MDKTERFYKIIQLLRNSSGNTVNTFLDELEVSRATFNRDLEYMRDRMNAPIIYSHSENTYQLDKSQGKFELPGIWLSAEEASSILSIITLLDNMDSGSLQNVIQPFRQKIINGLEKKGLEISDVIKRIRIINMNARSVEPRYFELVSSSVLNRKQARILFYNRNRNEEAWRSTSPQRLIHYRDNWYLDAFDHDIQQLRTFSLGCINDVIILEQTAIEIDNEKLDKELASAYGIFSGEETKQAVLKFTEERARWVAYENWHPQQKGEFDKKGNYLLSIPYAIEHELIMDILKHGTHVKVISPPELVKSVKDIVSATLKQYE